MRIFWWQGGLHVQPESDPERAALVLLSDSLNGVQINQGIPAGPGIDGRNEQSVIGVNKLPSMVTEGRSAFGPSDGPLREQDPFRADAL